MAFSIYKAGVKKTIANVRIRKSGAHKNVNFIRIWKTIGGMGAWRDVWVRAGPPPPAPPPPVVVPPPPPPVTLTVSIAPATVNGNKITALAADSAQTSIATATVSGGTGPYTYNWSVVSWSHLTKTPTVVAQVDPAQARFNQTQIAANTDESAVFKCIVQDSLGNTGSATVNAHWAVTTRDWDIGDNR